MRGKTCHKKMIGFKVLIILAFVSLTFQDDNYFTKLSTIVNSDEETSKASNNYANIGFTRTADESSKEDYASDSSANIWILPIDEETTEFVLPACKFKEDSISITVHEVNRILISWRMEDPNCIDMNFTINICDSKNFTNPVRSDFSTSFKELRYEGFAMSECIIYYVIVHDRLPVEIKMKPILTNMILNVNEFLNEYLGLNVSWSPASTCKLRYIIHVDYQNGTRMNKTETDNEYQIFTNLEACETYNITVFPKENEDKRETIQHKMITISAVRSLSAEYDEFKHSIKVEWQIPKYGSKCIKNYKIKVSGTVEQPFETNDTVFNYSRIKHCQAYNFTVFSVSDLGNGLTSRTQIYIPTKVLKPMQQKANATTLTLQTQFNNIGNICSVASIEFRCSSNISRQFFDFTVKEGSTIETTITGLSPSTNYTCSARLRITQIGWTNYSERSLFQTSELISSKDWSIFLTFVIFVFCMLLVSFASGFYVVHQNSPYFWMKKTYPTIDSKDITVADFPIYRAIMTQNENSRIKDEYLEIQCYAEQLNTSTAIAKQNEILNRYLNISPFDYNRVILDKPGCDYINASYIHGYAYPREYIAAQGPKPNTCHEFWLMVLQNRIESIVMLTSFAEKQKIKCYEYYPKLQCEIFFNDINVSCVSEETDENFDRKILRIEKDGIKRICKHYFYKKWPDHGCPPNTQELINFCKMIRHERYDLRGTIIIHCSAGVGRTGTFIAIDIIIQRLKDKRKINIYDLVLKLREQRVKMVQTVDQYIFLYSCANDLAMKNRNVKDVKRRIDNILNRIEIPMTNVEEAKENDVESEATENKNNISN